MRKLSKPRLEQCKHILAPESVVDDAEDRLYQPHCGLDVDIDARVHEVRYAVFFKRHVEHAAIICGVAADHGDIPVAQPFSEHQLLYAARRELTFRVKVGGAVEHDIPGGFAADGGVAAENALFKKGELVAFKAALLLELHGRLDIDIIAPRDIRKLFSGLARNLENAFAVAARRV